MILTCIKIEMAKSVDAFLSRIFQECLKYFTGQQIFNVLLKVDLSTICACHCYQSVDLCDEHVASLPAISLWNFLSGSNLLACFEVEIFNLVGRV